VEGIQIETDVAAAVRNKREECRHDVWGLADQNVFVVFISRHLFKEIQLQPDKVWFFSLIIFWKTYQKGNDSCLF
jgi:hypothetical protein